MECHPSPESFLFDLNDGKHQNRSQMDDDYDSDDDDD